MAARHIVEGAGRIRKYLVKNNTEFTHYAVMGSSGSMLAGMLLLLDKGDKEYIYVKKTGETSRYSTSRIKGRTIHVDKIKYIIVDDCVETGETVLNIYNEIKRNIPNAECIDIICYSPPAGITEITLGDRLHKIKYVMDYV
jgi:phosphoribosylpyrophosphate synthetase